MRPTVFLFLLTISIPFISPATQPKINQEPTTHDLIRSLQSDITKLAKQLDIYLFTPGVSMPNADEADDQIFRIRDDLQKLRQIIGIDLTLFRHSGFK